MDNIFKPIDLNLETVKQIFSDCMPVDGKTQNICGVILQQKAMGFPQDSDAVYFDIDKLDANKKNVAYLLGQLYSIHQGKYFFKISDI